MRVLITGGAGFIGSHTAELLARGGHDVRILDALSPQIHGSAAAFSDGLSRLAECRKGSVTDGDVVAAALEGVDAVAHFAAQTGVGQSLWEARAYADANVLGAVTVLEAVIRRGKPYPRFLLSSSRAVYGEGSARCLSHGLVHLPPRERSRLEKRDFLPRCPLCGETARPVPSEEGHPFAPVSFYGWTKQAQEEVCRQMALTYGLPIAILRYFNVYGSRQSLLNPYTGLVTVFYNRLRAGRPLVLYEGGLPVRDFVHVSDVARANVTMLTRESPAAGTWNIGSGDGVTIRDLALSLGEVMGRSVVMRDRGDYRLGDIFSGVAVISRARKDLPYEPSVSLKEGLAEFVRWANLQTAVEDGDRAEAELRRQGLFGSAGGMG